MKLLEKCMVLLINAHLLMATVAKNTTTLDPRYDEMNNDLVCYSKYDKSRVVRCNSACVQKRIVSRYKINSEYDFDFYYRVGCESKSFNPELQKLQCSVKEFYGSAYTIDYMIKGDTTRNPRLFVRKTCCFTPYCNEPVLYSHRYWFRRNWSMLAIMRNKYNSQHLLLFVVTSLIGILMVYGIVTKVMSWFKSKQMSQSGQKCRELEHELILESSFKDSTIVDTGLEVTGRLTVKETAYLLSQLPDQDKVKYSRMKSVSTEESSKSKSAQSLAVVESEVVAGSGTRRVFIKPPLKTKAKGWGHTLWSTVRTINSPYDLLYRMIEHGPYQYPFTALELLCLFEETAFKMAEEPSLLQIEADITVIGDIRGRYADLHRWLQLTGWPPHNRILFLGGILDSGESGSVECLALICSLKCRFPKHVFILRGEPETSPFRMSTRLHPVITRAVQSCIKRMCTHMPFAAIIGKSVLAVYSGFSPMIREKGHIHHLFRPVTAEHMNAVERHIIFNQPSNRVRMYRPNPNTEGDWFGKQAVKRACKATRCNVMIRGQSYVPYGYLPCWNNRLINLWSAPGYGSDFGAILSISKDLVITPILMEKQT
ncbi:Serine/threonine specific protein phosphatases domain-containing protein [Caenorhabditis elegans]|uniref:Serine/threonine specific protein phosphatases domain-containing protein n=1 Tax=Caenorhabditis elegans TaxID=6239 RepID=Q09598_CAEEL|nr:Serine/threonine specific protein phosphatases domain-containing protein [Caenorhabditis elegans]CAA86861.3 Serine/threonine specific protein phosphatases domain-containing protein [Caenorhabditis elegans]|eukprot:NP_496359.2 Uncharacterized protein CELE_R03D7.8 [Caenorhabditis elegans]